MRGLLVFASLLGCAREAPPVTFSNLRVEMVTATRAVARFNTSAPTSCRVLFGQDAAALTRSATDPNMAPGTLVTDHTVPLEDLTAMATWHWRAEAVDQDKRTFLSDPQSFTTAMGVSTGNLTNVALRSAGTTVTAVSSNYGGAGVDSAWGANNAVDGAMATEWATQGDGDGAWLDLDLGVTREVVRLGFRSRKMTDGTSIIQAFRVRVEDGTWLGPFESPNPDETYSFDLAAPVMTRTIHLEATRTTGGNTGAREIEVYTAP